MESARRAGPSTPCFHKFTRCHDGCLDTYYPDKIDKHCQFTSCVQHKKILFIARSHCKPSALLHIVKPCRESNPCIVESASMHRHYLLLCAVLPAGLVRAVCVGLPALPASMSRNRNCGFDVACYIACVHHATSSARPPCDIACVHHATSSARPPCDIACVHHATPRASIMLHRVRPPCYIACVRHGASERSISTVHH